MKISRKKDISKLSIAKLKIEIKKYTELYKQASLAESKDIIIELKAFKDEYTRKLVQKAVAR